MTRLLAFWASHRAEFIALLAQHITLVAVSTLAAVAIGIPLGIFAARRPRFSAPIVGLANVVQTIPSLAMFGFLLPVPARWRYRRPRGHRRADSVRAAAHRADHHHRDHEHRSVHSRGGRGDGDDAARTASPGRAAAGAAVDCGRGAGGGRCRRRVGDDRGGDRRGRSRRVHLPRPVDGRFDRDPGRCGSGGAAGARRRRRAAVGRAAAVGEAPHRVAQGRRGRGRRRSADACRWRRSPADRAARSWSDRRTSPSR